MKQQMMQPMKSADVIPHSPQSVQQLLGMEVTDDELDYATLYQKIDALMTLHETLQRKSDIDGRDIKRLIGYIDQLEHDINAVQHSLAWRVGFKLVTLLKKLLGRNTGSHAFEQMNHTFTIYHHWKKARG